MTENPLDDFIAEILELPYDPYRGEVTGTEEYEPRYPEAFPAGFEETVWHADDGTPISVTYGFHDDLTPRPAVLLANPWLMRKTTPYLVELALCLHQNGFHVCGFDFRGTGQSRRLSEAAFTDGWKEAEDTLALVRDLKSRPNVSLVGGVGLSFGGAIMTSVVGMDPAGDLAAGIAFSCWTAQPIGFTDSRIRANWVRYVKDFPDEYLERSAAYYGATKEHLYRQLHHYKALRDAKVPFLLVHALDDVECLPKFPIAYAAIAQEQPNTRSLLLSSGGHAAFYDYWWQEALVLRFFKRFLAPDDERVAVTPRLTRKDYPGAYQPEPTRSSAIVPPLRFNRSDALALGAIFDDGPQTRDDR
ncbi:MAG: prolyl oligopeptidase family serine peptidase [Chloroflexi bacterium]|nr:prolyl oligopeptidase family serine peptidase [Chloroflexota bacterium]